jgi:hypothetical protein
MGARLALCFEKPLWADEIFTLALARQTFPAILDALKGDSGPPLHYLLAKLALLPFPVPGPGDVSVRLLSFVAALAHVPLFLAIGRRMGSPRGAWTAAALYSLFPVAVAYGSEGRGYALASLLVLAAFERSLAARDGPVPGAAMAAAAAGLCAGGALLTHYLALFPLVGIVIALWRGGPAIRHAVSAGLAILAFAPWVPIAFGQPAASMGWVRNSSPAEAAGRFVTDLALGIDWSGAASPLLLGAAAVLLVAWLVPGGSGGRAAATVASGGACLAIAGLAFPVVLLPERSAVLFLPFTALALASAPRAVAAAAGALGAVFLSLQAPGWTRTSPSEDLAARLAGPVRGGSQVAAVGLWGPELRYRMARAGRPEAVVLFPSDVGRHPGWFSEDEVPDERLRNEARNLVTGTRRPEFLVLPRGSRAARSLQEEIAPGDATRVGATPLLEVYRLRPLRSVPGSWAE